jgi:hypothetical protein
MTYVVFAAIATGVEKFASCQPDAVSLENVTLARLTPLLVHNAPMCVPVLSLPL